MPSERSGRQLVLVCGKTSPVILSRNGAFILKREISRNVITINMRAH